MNRSVEVRTGEYKVYYDVLRLLAIFFVVFNHTPAFHFPFQSSGNSLIVYAMMIISALDKVAVPLFFMISGALLLAKQESVVTVLRKRVVRFVCVILLFHFIQASWYSLSGGANGVGIRSFLGDCYWGGCNHGYVLASVGAYAVWFLYAYLGVLLMLPFLRSMVEVMGRSQFFYLFGLQIVCCVLIPSAFILVTGESSADGGLLKYLPICGNVLVYVLAGYYVENRVVIASLQRKHIVYMLLASIVFLGLAVTMPEIARIRMGAPCMSQYIPGITSFLLIPCMTIVLIMKRLCGGCGQLSIVARALRYLGGAVFTVMLVENILREWISSLFPGYETSYLPSIWVSGLVCLVGLGLGLVLKQFPVLKKLL